MEGAPETGQERIAILGAGNIGQALAEGWTSAGIRAPGQIVLTRRQPERLERYAERGFQVTADNRAAAEAARTLVMAVQPQQVAELLEEVGPALEPDRHLLVSVVSDVTIGDIQGHLGAPVRVVRAMPNTAIAIGESMTCLSASDGAGQALEEARELFDAVGETMVIREDLMVSATALVACGVAFFLRAVRAASQGGIEIGFHPEEALRMAAQTARGAASLLARDETHPESEVDRVTTPRGCTIAGLNEMEHQGFSSALIKGITVSARKAAELYDE
jgi:pyrroline-5-carboxylate reductase